MEKLKFQVSAALGRTDAPAECFLDFTAHVYDPVEDMYIDALNGIVWLTGAGIDDDTARNGSVVPVPQSIGVRWIEHTLMVSDPIVGAQFMARMKVPGLPRDATMVGTSIGDVSGTSSVQLWSEDVNVVLYRKENHAAA